MFNIAETYAQMGKISNNLEKHGEKDVTAFDIPISAVTLKPEQFNALSEDAYADRWLFSDKADIREPNLSKFEPLVLRDTFEEALVAMKVGGDAFSFADARIKDVQFEGKRGGDILCSFNVRVRPENDKQILQLIAYQNREISIDIQDAKVCMKGGRRQQELPLNTHGEGEQPEQGAKKRGRPRKSDSAPVTH